jgi:hypothetical protein
MDLAAARWPLRWRRGTPAPMPAWKKKGDPANPSVVERLAGPSVLVLWMFGCAVGDDAADVVGRYACAKCGRQQ